VLCDCLSVFSSICVLIGTADLYCISIFLRVDNNLFGLLGGPYAAFGGKDASRGLATFSVTASEVEYDDLSDLSPPEMDSVREWEMQFKGESLVVGRFCEFLLNSAFVSLTEKYELVGRLLKVKANEFDNDLKFLTHIFYF
jgi:hypothetical protein